MQVHLLWRLKDGKISENVKRIFCMRSMIVSLNIGNAKYERKRENSSPFSPEPKSAWRRFFRIRELSTYDFSNWANEIWDPENFIDSAQCNWLKPKNTSCFLIVSFLRWSIRIDNSTAHIVSGLVLKSPKLGKMFSLRQVDEKADFALGERQGLLQTESIIAIIYLHIANSNYTITLTL